MVTESPEMVTESPEMMTDRRRWRLKLLGFGFAERERNGERERRWCFDLI
jgi:hypothetical protein